MSAIPFIMCCPVSGEYNVTEEAVKFLSGLSNRPLGVVTIAGKYRTGKSLFLNRVLLQKAKAFGTGSSVNACTKGIWLYTQTMITSNGLEVLVMDSEGIGSLDADSTHDSRIFALAILLSSLFIYNSVGSIDDSALRALSLVTNISKQIRVSQESETTTQELAKVFPSFCWVVRDFSLRLENRQGDSINADTYLESALCSLNPNEDTNSVKKVISECFPDRCCMTMVRPCQEEDDLQNLDNMDNGELRPVFVEQMEEIRCKLMAKVKVKDYLGHGVTGNMLVTLAKQYVTAINKGVAPVIKDSWQLMTEIQTRDVFESSWEKFLQGVGDSVVGNRKPTDYKYELDQQVEFYLDYFDNNVMQPSNSMRKKLDKRMLDWVAQTLEKNEIGLKESLNVVITNLSETISKCSDINEVQSEIVGLRCLWEVDYCDYTDNMWNSSVLGILWQHLLPLCNNQTQSLELFKSTNDKLLVKNDQTEKRLIILEQNNLALKKDYHQIQGESIQTSGELSACKDECENLQTLITETENHKANDATLLLQLEDAQKQSASLNIQVVALREQIDQNEAKSQTSLNSIQLHAVNSLNQYKTKNQCLSNELLLTKSEVVKQKELFQTDVKSLTSECSLLQSSEKKLNDQMDILKSNQNRLQSSLKEKKLLLVEQNEKLYQLQESNLQCTIGLNAKIKELETERACESINFTTCRKRLAEVQETSTKHKKLKIDLHRSDTEMEKHKSLADWLVKDKVIKENRIVELQNQVNELEKRCYDTQKQYEIDVLKMKLVSNH